MTDGTLHDGLPVAGYRSQTDVRVAIVNDHKITEEILLRRIEGLTAAGVMDPRWGAIARTDLEKAFMSLNRAVFQPGRVDLLPAGADKIEALVDLLKSR